MPVSMPFPVGLAFLAAPLAFYACSGAQHTPGGTTGDGRRTAPAGPVSATPVPDSGAVDAGSTDAASTEGSLETAPRAGGEARSEIEDDFPPGTQSLRVRELAHVIGEPRDGARYIGKITAGTRVAYKRIVAPDEPSDAARRRKRRRCPVWVEIEPRGYLCKDLLTPSDEPPRGDVQPVVRPGRLTPDRYFKVHDETKVYASEADVVEDVVEKVLSSKVMVIGYGVHEIDGVAYRKTDHGLVEASRLSPLWPSKFAGRRLDDLASVTWPFGWVHFERWARAPFVRDEPRADARRVRRAALREIVSVLDDQDGFVRIGDGEWIDRNSLRLAILRAPPSGIDGSEQWIDVDLDHQVLIAYEGAAPVFATLVSTGAVRHETPVALYRVRAKAATTPMAGDPRVPNRYEVSGVPWAIRFADGYYIHGAYWHDGFGGPRSHGCVNVSPADAAFLYEWVEPKAPAGWSEVEVPGGEGVRIRVHDADNPHPDPFDYSEEEPWNFPPEGGAAADR